MSPYRGFRQELRRILACRISRGVASLFSKPDVYVTLSRALLSVLPSHSVGSRRGLVNAAAGALRLLISPTRFSSKRAPSRTAVNYASPDSPVRRVTALVTLHTFSFLQQHACCRGES